ncbi:unnamed protein product [Closterium sp. NIES-54]
MYITLYFIVTRLPDSLRAIRDHFLKLNPTDLTDDLLEQHHLAAETSIVTVGATCGTPRTPFFEGCSPSPLAPSYASAAAVDVLGAKDVMVASASGKRRISKGKGGRSSGGGSGGCGGGDSRGGGGSGGGGSCGSGGGSGGFGGGGGGSGGSGGSGGGGGQRQQQQRRSKTPSTQQLREWFAQREASGSSVLCPYVIRTGDRAGQTCGKPHTQHRYFFCLDDAWRAEFGDEAERPRWAELLWSRVAIFDLDYDVILAAMYAISVSAEGDCYMCVPPSPGIEDAALGASESALPGLCHPSRPRLPRPAFVASRGGSAPLLTPPRFPRRLLPMDVWGPARVSGQGRERYLLLVVDDYTRYTTVFPLRSKGEVHAVLIPWIPAVCLQMDGSSSAMTFLSCVCTLTEVVSSPPASCRAFVVGRAFSSRSRFWPPRSKMGLLSAALA